MTEKILATQGSRSVVARFENEQEYQEFCGLIVSQCLDELMKSLSLDELISLWKDRNSAKQR